MCFSIDEKAKPWRRRVVYKILQVMYEPLRKKNTPRNWSGPYYTDSSQPLKPGVTYVARNGKLGEEIVTASSVNIYGIRRTRHGIYVYATQEGHLS